MLFNNRRRLSANGVAGNEDDIVMVHQNASAKKTESPRALARAPMSAPLSWSAQNKAVLCGHLVGENALG